jgi:hypothetical protein
MWRWRAAVAAASLVQIALGLVLYGVALAPEGGRLGLATGGLAGGLALVALVAAPVRFWAVGLNSLLFFACLPPLFAGLLDGFAPPRDGSPLGAWLYPAVGVFATASACNGVVLHLLATRGRGPAKPSGPDDPARDSTSPDS